MGAAAAYKAAKAGECYPWAHAQSLLASVNSQICQTLSRGAAGGQNSHPQSTGTRGGHQLCPSVKARWQGLQLAAQGPPASHRSLRDPPASPIPGSVGAGLGGVGGVGGIGGVGGLGVSTGMERRPELPRWGPQAWAEPTLTRPSCARRGGASGRSRSWSRSRSEAWESARSVCGVGGWRGQGREGRGSSLPPRKEGRGPAAAGGAASQAPRVVPWQECWTVGAYLPGPSSRSWSRKRSQRHALWQALK